MASRAFALLLPVLLAATLAAYRPAWHGAPVWDDEGHITPVELRSAAGLGRIWSQVGATQQYYPLVHTAFWILSRTAGDNTLAYHLTNITLHALAAFLLILILRRLQVPGAVLAGIVFALHPVQVESVAWIAELKNTLSGVLYLSAALMYLRFDRARGARWYALAFALFLMALASKSVTATLPAALLVVIWWQRGRLRWRGDVAPLLPFAAAGAASGLLTAWVERTYVGAQGGEFHLTVIERVLIAGRAVSFYLWKIVWPAHLMFVYPRWAVSSRIAWQYVFPLAVAVVLIGLWRLRGRTRAPAAALFFFIVTLSPALGFVDVFPFQFSFVADHFQYLASIGPIALAAAALMAAGSRMRLNPRTAEAGLALTFGLLLGVLSWHQSHQYVDAETLYRSTIARNPDCWMAYNNLGALKLTGTLNDLNDGLPLIKKALELNPEDAEAHNNLGYAWYRLGRYEGARSEHLAAVRLSPNFAAARANLGADLLALGQIDEAVAIYRALPPSARYAEAHDSLGTALMKLGRMDEAVREYQEAIGLNPRVAGTHNNLGMAWERRGQIDRAVAEYAEALRLQPDAARTHDNLGFVLQRTGHPDDAMAHFSEAVRLDPGYAPAHYNLANGLLDKGRVEEAITHYRRAIALEPGGGSAEAHNNLGVAFMQTGRTQEGIAELRQAVRIDPTFAKARDNLARALGRPPK